jgi:hypothetical protein
MAVRYRFATNLVDASEAILSAFDQRGQTVHGNQINMAFGEQFRSADDAKLLVDLLQSFSGTVAHSDLDDETSADVQHELRQAIAGVQSGDGPKTRKRLESARTILQAIAGAGSLAAPLTDAIHACTRIIGG